MNESINYGGVCRTAPATPGLLIILHNTTAQRRFLDTKKQVLFFSLEMGDTVDPNISPAP